MVIDRVGSIDDIEFISAIDIFFDSLFSRDKKVIAVGGCMAEKS